MGAPAQRGEQYSNRLHTMDMGRSFVYGQELRYAKEGLCMMEDAESATGFVSQLTITSF